MKNPPDDYDLQDVPNVEGLSRRRFLLGTLLSPSVMPQLGLVAAPAQQLAATEESLETENNWEGPFYKPGAPARSMGEVPWTLSSLSYRVPSYVSLRWC